MLAGLLFRMHGPNWNFQLPLDWFIFAQSANIRWYDRHITSRVGRKWMKLRRLLLSIRALTFSPCWIRFWTFYSVPCPLMLIGNSQSTLRQSIPIEFVLNWNSFIVWNKTDVKLNQMTYPLDFGVPQCLTRTPAISWSVCVLWAHKCFKKRKKRRHSVLRKVYKYVFSSSDTQKP